MYFTWKWAVSPQIKLIIIPKIKMAIPNSHIDYKHIFNIVDWHFNVSQWQHHKSVATSHHLSKRESNYIQTHNNNTTYFFYNLVATVWSMIWNFVFVVGYRCLLFQLLLFVGIQFYLYNFMRDLQWLFYFWFTIYFV